MKRSKPTPEEMALAVALGIFPAKRCAAIFAAISKERESEKTSNSTSGSHVALEPRLSASDAHWLQAVGVRWE